MISYKLEKQMQDHTNNLYNSSATRARLSLELNAIIGAIVRVSGGGS